MCSVITKSRASKQLLHHSKFITSFFIYFLTSSELCRLLLSWRYTNGNYEKRIRKFTDENIWVDQKPGRFQSFIAWADVIRISVNSTYKITGLVICSVKHHVRYCFVSIRGRYDMVIMHWMFWHSCCTAWEDNMVELKTMKTGKKEILLLLICSCISESIHTYLQIQLLKIQPTNFAAQNRTTNQLLARSHEGDTFTWRLGCISPGVW